MSAGVNAQRLRAQQLDRPELQTAEDLVAWFGAVQAQDYAGSKWALGVRLSGLLDRPAPTDAAVERLLASGAILRTHAFRFTWQLVAPADVRWMLALVAPRLKARAARRNKELELDASTLLKSNAVLERVLRDGQHRIRAELSTALERAGISTAGQRLSHLLAHAELDAVIVSGARRGKQSTHALLEQRAPKARAPLARDEALSELALRYVKSRGPATAADFSWWSGLPASEARAGLEAIKSTVVCEVRGGQRYFRSSEHSTPRARRSPAALLLPAFDEYLIAYRAREASLDPAQAKRINAGGGLLDPVVVVSGRVIGRWRRTLARSAVTIAIEPFESGTAQTKRAMVAGAQSYAAFIELGASVSIDPA
jgi:hypothetical protein